MNEFSPRSYSRPRASLMERKMAKYLVLLCSAWVLAAEDFDPAKTLLIDYYPRNNPQNFLFRGNLPVVNGSFAYDTIVHTMSSVAGKNNLSFPDNFSLIDVSYLNILEKNDLAIEEAFFRDHPAKGQLYNKVIVGTEFTPPQDDEGLIKGVVKEYVDTLSFDKLPSLMEFLHGLLTTPDNGHLVIYTHCEAGTDRTGEVSGSYYIKFLDMTFLDALYIDNHVSSRDMYKVSRNELQWYCFYLKFVENMPIDCLV